uniref:Uncharacterized protein n=1 Tax=Oryza brachyantha TaxID=4533 RepID=J3MXJ0_ORYBR
MPIESKAHFLRNSTDLETQQFQATAPPNLLLRLSHGFVKGSRAREDGGSSYHLVDDVDGVAEVGGLESGGGERREQPGEPEPGVVEVGAGDPREPPLVEGLRGLQHDRAHALQRVHVAHSSSSSRAAAASCPGHRPRRWRPSSSRRRRREL